MRAIKIDPVNRRITEIEFEDSLDNMHKVLSCSCVTPVYLNRKDILWVDDNGWIEYQAYGGFHCVGYNHPLAGFGLILGHDHLGNNTSTSMTLEKAQESFLFLPTDLAEKVRKFYERR